MVATLIRHGRKDLAKQVVTAGDDATEYVKKLAKAHAALVSLHKRAVNWSTNC